MDANGHNRSVRNGATNGTGLRRSRIPLRIGRSLTSPRLPQSESPIPRSNSENASQRQSISPTRNRTSKIPRLTPPSSPTLFSVVPLTNGNRSHRTNGTSVDPVGTNGMRRSLEDVNGNHSYDQHTNVDNHRYELLDTSNGNGNVEHLEDVSDQEFEELEKELGIVSEVEAEIDSEEYNSSSSTVCNEEDNDSSSSELMDLMAENVAETSKDITKDGEECFERDGNEVEDDSGIVCEDSDTSAAMGEIGIKDMVEPDAASICSSDGFDKSLDCKPQLLLSVDAKVAETSEEISKVVDSDVARQDIQWVSEMEIDSSINISEKKTLVPDEECVSVCCDNPDVLDILSHIKTMARHQYAPDVVPHVEENIASDTKLEFPSAGICDIVEKSETLPEGVAFPVETTAEKSERSWPFQSSSKENLAAEAKRENSSRTEAILATSNMLKACIGRSPMPALANSKFSGAAFTVTSNVAATSTFVQNYMKSIHDKKKEEKKEEEDDQLLKALAPEEVKDMEILERMMNAATSYDQRRRIRSQIRLLKKNEDDGRQSRRQFDSTFSIKPIDGVATKSGVCFSSLSKDGATNATTISSAAVWETVDSLVASSLNGVFDAQNDGNEPENEKKTDFGRRPSADSSETRTVEIMGDWVDGINLSDIHDELKLHEMLDAAQDYEDRKKVRARLKDVIAQNRAQREEMIRRREDEREETIRARLRDADEQKKRTMAMYDAMAKSAPAGGNKTLDVNILREDMDCKENRCSLPEYKSMLQSVNRCSNRTGVGLDTYVSSSSSVRSASFTVTEFINKSNGMEYTTSEKRLVSLSYGRGSGHSTPTHIEPVGGPKVDLVEQAIRERQKEADDRKKRILTAYDNAAKSGPAGATRFIDFESVKPSDVQNYQPKPTPYSSTFKMSGGIPQSFPGGTQPFLPRRPESEAPYDPMEEAIRRRQKEADDRKRRTLEAYDKAAKSRPAGEPVSIYIPYDDDVAPVIEVAKRISPKEKFQQLDSAAAPKGAATSAVARPAGAGIVRSPTAIKEMLLNWCKSKTREYENVSIDNFSTSWNDGMAFCALIHHFYPDAFDFESLNPKNRRHNFDLAFRTAEEKGDVAPLLDVDDMVMMKKPDWKCVFTYVQSLYRRFHNVD